MRWNWSPPPRIELILQFGFVLVLAWLVTHRLIDAIRAYPHDVKFYHPVLPMTHEDQETVPMPVGHLDRG